MSLMPLLRIDGEHVVWDIRAIHILPGSQSIICVDTLYTDIMRMNYAPRDGHVLRKTASKAA